MHGSDRKAEWIRKPIFILFRNMVPYHPSRICFLIPSLKILDGVWEKENLWKNAIHIKLQRQLWAA